MAPGCPTRSADFQAVGSPTRSGCQASAVPFQVRAHLIEDVARTLHFVTSRQSANQYWSRPSPGEFARCGSAHLARADYLFGQFALGEIHVGVAVNLRHPPSSTFPIKSCHVPSCDITPCLKLR